MVKYEFAMETKLLKVDFLLFAFEFVFVGHIDTSKNTQ